MENETIAVLQLMLTQGLGAKTLWRLLVRLGAEGQSPADVVNSAANDVVRQFSLKPDVALGIPTTRDNALRLYEELARHEIRVLAVGSSEYPSRLRQVLGETAPPVLFAHGNLDLLECQAVGFCGSRKASELGLKTTRGYARAIAESGITVVSGYAHGVDLAAHSGAMEGGGTTVLVLAEGILRFKMKADLGDLVSDSNYVVVSEFPPHLGWIARNAMQRNRTICGLSDAVILVESGMTGGTFAAGETALELRRPLFVISYGDSEPRVEGNEHFLARGALPLRPDFSDEAVGSVVSAAKSGKEFHMRQRSLFD